MNYHECNFHCNLFPNNSALKCRSEQAALDTGLNEHFFLYTKLTQRIICASFPLLVRPSSELVR